jgi:hypothetical protein
MVIITIKELIACLTDKTSVPLALGKNYSPLINSQVWRGLQELEKQEEKRNYFAVSREALQ